MIPLFKVHMPKGVGVKLEEVLMSGYIAEGDYVRKFEKLLSEFGKNSNVVATNSCTSALHLALAMETKKDPGYVITPAQTCVATNVSIVNLNNTIIWCDVDKTNGMMTRETLLQVWDKLPIDIRKKVKAVIFVMWGGDVGDLKRVYETTQELGVSLIVDAAQGMGAQVDGNPIPSLYGDYICWSFQAIKWISTGDGGCLFVRNPENLHRASILKWFGIDREMFRTPTGEINWKADIPEIGYKFHMNNIAACIGIAQMEDNLQARLDISKENSRFYNAAFKGKDFKRTDNVETSANWVYTATTSQNVDNMIEKLLKTGINSSRMHLPNNIYTGFNAKQVTSLEGTEYFHQHHICIPCGCWVSFIDLQYIVDEVKKCLDVQS